MCCLLKLTAGQISSESNDKVSMTFSYGISVRKCKNWKLCLYSIKRFFMIIQ